MVMCNTCRMAIDLSVDTPIYFSELWSMGGRRNCKSAAWNSNVSGKQICIGTEISGVGHCCGKFLFKVAAGVEKAAEGNKEVCHWEQVQLHYWLFLNFVRTIGGMCTIFQWDMCLWEQF